MARTSNQDYSVRRGKLNKKDKVIYRLSYGKQQVYTADNSSIPPTKAQKKNRSNFGKVTSIVNAIMLDPQQVAEWQQQMDEYQHTRPLDGSTKKYKTLRQFVHAVISAKLADSQSSKRRRKTVQKALPKGLKLHIKSFAELTTTELYEIIKARFNVFYLEQHICYPDLDNIDYSATHLAIHRRARVIAYARLFPGKEPGQFIVGRLLTTERGKGFGKYIMEQVEQEAIRQGASSLLIHAQTQVAPFYESLGYSAFGDIFLEADIPHVHMKKALK